MTDKEMVKAIREEGYIGMDLPLYSKTKRQDYYGVDLIPELRVKVGKSLKVHGDTQNEKIIRYAKEMHGITSLEATNVLHIMSFTKRMSEIRRDPRYIVRQHWAMNSTTRWMVYEIEERDEKV